MAEVLVTFTHTVAGPDGAIYTARACGREKADGRWEGWLEFYAVDGADTLRSARETTQPNRTDTAYWATGLTPVYLEGALARALRPAIPSQAQAEITPAFDRPGPHAAPQKGRAESVLNPFSVYRKGEDVLRRQLGALAAWHLVNIAEAYELSGVSREELAAMSPADLSELIVSGVREGNERLQS